MQREPERERGSARSQMEKFATGKFHFEPPFTSFDHLVGASVQTQLGRKMMKHLSKVGFVYPAVTGQAFFKPQSHQPSSQ